MRKEWRSELLIALLLIAAAIPPAASPAETGLGRDNDTRLLHKVTLHDKGVALSDFCAELQAQTGVELSASRTVADEKVTIFVEGQPAREVMREVARLFGYFWLRSGHKGGYRYELDQDLRSQLAEEELRNHDRDAAVLALDEQMQKYRPYVGTSFDELQKLGEVGGETGRFMLDLVHSPRWGGMQLYFHLTPADQAALFSGQELVFRPDAPNPDRRLPAEWSRPLLMCAGPGVSFSGRQTELVDLPAARVSQVRLGLYRSEGGQLSLIVRMTVWWNDGSVEAMFFNERLLATGRSPSVANPDNAHANTALRGRPPLDRVISLELIPSCRAVKPLRRGDLDPDLDRASLTLDRSRPYALSSDVWEAIHRATGVPIIADFYTRLYPVDKLTIERRSLFDALCAAGDALGARWTTDGGYLLCRSTGYFWDKLAEVPNRYLQRWVQDRDASGGLPFTDFLEMANMSDEQLDSAAVAEGIEHFWGLREWVLLGGTLDRWMRQQARLLAMLTPEQLRRTFQPQGLPFKDLTPAQQQAVIQLHQLLIENLERQGSRIPPAMAGQSDNVVITAAYIPAGWYAARGPSRMKYVGGRTADEAAAAARRLYPGFSPPEVRRADDGYFIANLTFFINKG